MSKKKDWVNDIFKQAKQTHPLVTADVEACIAGLLNNQLGERSLKGVELAKTAKGLIAKMTGPAQPDFGDSHED